MLQLIQDLTLKLSKDTGSKPLLLLASFSESFTESTELNESTTLHYKLATGTTDQQVNLGSVSAAEMLYIKADQAIKLKLNDTDGTSREITLKANKASILHADFTALYLSNDTGNEAEIHIVVAGD